ncbi:hypothetical protein [Pontibacter roseus]|uniref:hypothetical protein n=1 Tax=Pontibacter roseus TaxID=336989 RepID=UPI0003769B8A|nr:hypothetical protein [Pontibacter roseus]
MQEISIRLFSSAYSVRSRLERVLLLMALLSIALHGWLLYQLIAVKDFHSAMTFLYLFSLLPVCLFLASMWLDKNPGYNRHLTLLTTGVRYRKGFMQPEHEFDWEEVDSIRLEPRQVVFLLKNEEQHEVSLQAIRSEEVLHRVRSGILDIAAEKEIEIIHPQL